MTRRPRLDPWHLLLSAPHITLLRTALPAGERGRYYPEQDAIVLDARLSQAEARCTLAHELVHRRRGDRHCDDPVLAARQERECHEEAARWLIPFDALMAALMWGRTVAEWADELLVDEDTLQARVDGLTDLEREQIEQMLRDREGAA